MIMQTNQQQPWKLTIYTKAKNFHLKLKANKLFLPSCKLFQFSIKFKLHNFLINVKSEPHYSFPLKFKSKFLQVLAKLRIRRGNRSISAGKSFRIIRVPTRSAYKGSVGVSSVVARNIALLCRSISEKDLHGMFKIGSTMLLHLVSMVCNCLRRKKCSSILLVLMVAIFISPMLHLRKHFPISSYFSKAKIIVPLVEFIASLQWRQFI